MFPLDVLSSVVSLESNVVYQSVWCDGVKYVILYVFLYLLVRVDEKSAECTVFVGVSSMHFSAIQLHTDLISHI